MNKILKMALKNIVAFLLLGAVLILFSTCQRAPVPPGPYARKMYDNPESVLSMFYEKQEAFGQVAMLLWNRPDFLSF